MDRDSESYNAPTSFSTRRLPTASSRDSHYHSEQTHSRFADSVHSSSTQQQQTSPQTQSGPSATSGRVKKSKKKAAAAAAAAAMRSEPNTNPTPGSSNNPGSSGNANSNPSGYSAAQAAVNDMMRRALEEDQYSALGSVVDTDSSDEEDNEQNIYIKTGSTVGLSASGSSIKRMHYHSGGVGVDGITSMVKLDRVMILNAMRKRLRIEGMRGASVGNVIESKKRTNSFLIEESGEISGGVGIDGSCGELLEDGKDDRDKGSTVGGRGGNRKSKKRKKGKRGGARSGNGVEYTNDAIGASSGSNGGNGMDNQEDQYQFQDRDAISRIDGTGNGGDNVGENDDETVDYGAEESSIFGQTTGSSNATWVECDKCQKWRRLRGVVDTRKLPSKWYCAMNKGDPERSKCSAPEEEYDTTNTPESATDQRTRKHLRLWVRRLKSNENYEARLPTMTRGKRRSATTSAKEPYEWVRCCNPSCGKWRSLLRFMDDSSVMEASKNGEWFCVLNTWDEKTASCAAPQENLPAIGCPPWVMQDEE